MRIKAKLLCRIGLYVGLEDESDLKAAILECILIKGSKLSEIWLPKKRGGRKAYFGY